MATGHAMLVDLQELARHVSSMEGYGKRWLSKIANLGHGEATIGGETRNSALVSWLEILSAVDGCILAAETGARVTRSLSKPPAIAMESCESIAGQKIGNICDWTETELPSLGNRKGRSREKLREADVMGTE